MSSRLVELLENTIDKRYELPRKGRHWILKSEKQSTEPVEIRSTNSHCFAFTLDHKEKPLAFFSSFPPKGVAKMCDAIMACHYERQCYVFVIETKTNNRHDYKKQIKNGKLFCDWLLQLYKYHGHVHSPPIFVSLLIWFPRKMFPKKDYERRIKEEDKAEDFNHVFKIENQEVITVLQILKSITRN